MNLGRRLDHLVGIILRSSELLLGLMRCDSELGYSYIEPWRSARCRHLLFGRKHNLMDSWQWLLMLSSYYDPRRVPSHPNYIPYIRTEPQAKAQHGHQH
jgi:hypothetical protein